jgi:hypothetical protein
MKKRSRIEIAREIIARLRDEMKQRRSAELALASSVNAPVDAKPAVRDGRTVNYFPQTAFPTSR